MIVPRKPPKPVKSTVFVTNTKYEVWYAKPVSLGYVTYANWKWHSPDGTTFLSSRDAMRYMINLYDNQNPNAAPVKPHQQQPDSPGRTGKTRPPIPLDSKRRSPVANDRKAQLIEKLIDILDTRDDLLADEIDYSPPKKSRKR